MNDKVREKLEQLIQIVREETLAEFVAALGKQAPAKSKINGHANGTPVPVRRGRPPGKRNGRIVDFAPQVVEFVRSMPGRSIGEIGRHVKVKPKKLIYLLRNLREQGKIEMRGQRISARYYPAGA